MSAAAARRVVRSSLVWLLGAGCVVLFAFAVSAIASVPDEPPRPERLEALYTPQGRGFGVAPQEFWVRSNFHAHALKGTKGVGDDGRVPPRILHEVYEGLGYYFSIHTPHSNRNTTKRSPERWLALKEYEEIELDEFLTTPRSVGVELSVAHGPNMTFFKHRRYGRGVGRTINHAIVFGVDEYTPHLLPLKAACEMAHAFNGLVFVAHPVIWEKNYFDLEGNVDHLDGLEVFNGIVMVKTGETDEGTYRRLVSYGGKGAKIAAIAGTDAHGLAWVKEVITHVRTVANDVDGLVDAIKERKTVVTRHFFDLDIDFPQLGRIIRSAEVQLDLGFNQKMERIELWREEDLISAWESTDAVRWRERIAENAAYTFRFSDGEAQGMTSAVWFEPAPERLPDLVVPAERIEIRGTEVRAIVRNIGESTARFFDVAVYGRMPYGKKAKPRELVTIDELKPGEEARVEASFDELPQVIYVKADPESYGRPDDDKVKESEERNNAAVRVLSGRRKERADRANAIRRRRVEQRAKRGVMRRTIGRHEARQATLLPDYEEVTDAELEAHDD